MKIKLTLSAFIITSLMISVTVKAQGPGSYVLRDGSGGNSACYSGTPITIGFREEGPCSGTVNSWSVFPSTGVTITSLPQDKASIIFSAAGTYTVSANVTCSGGTTLNPQTTFTVTASTIFPNRTFTFGNWENISLSAPDDATSAVWTDGTNQLATGVVYNVGYIYDISQSPITYNVQLESASGCGSTAQYTVVVSDQRDDKLNSIETKGFDLDGTIASHSKNYFDNAGRPVQQQSKLFTGDDKVFIGQSLWDQYGRTVGSTLSAPGRYDFFNYQVDFVWGNGKPYSYEDFDLPATLMSPNPVSEKSGTLGWYYGAGKTANGHNLDTDFPYNRTDFHVDEFTAPRRSASAGNQHRMGSGHEIWSATLPVYNELNDYIGRRDDVIPGVSLISSMQNAGIQTISRDQNGLINMAISDKAGKTVMTAREGTSTDKVLTVSNTVEVATSQSLANPMIYFYLLENQTVALSGVGLFSIENLFTGSKVDRTITAGSINETLTRGFYRIILKSGTNVIVSYTNHFADVAYMYYDNNGRLRYSLSPNGYVQLTSQGATYATADHTEYSYNYLGWTLSLKESDAGTTNYFYASDGKILYSQNAEQAKSSNGYFSYTSYDNLNRPIESGEYRPPAGSAYTFATLNKSIQLSAQPNYQDVNKVSWVRTYYDNRDAVAIPNLPATYKQDFVRGAVSYSENANMKSWFSYDEFGRVKWMAQKTKYLPMTFLTEYTHDYFGNVTKVKTQYYDATGAFEPFYHHYEYDDDNRLQATSTSTDGTTTTLRATYSYYLHGPLKRIELGKNIQGIDFVYNINGWLTQINHPDKAQDPGTDGNDAFGMLIDYYESSISNLFQPESTGGLSPDYFHRLPDIDNQEIRTAVASTSKNKTNIMELQRSLIMLQKSYGR